MTDFFKREGINFVVRFDKIFDNKEFEKFIYFILSSNTQRTYTTKVGMVCESLNDFLNFCDKTVRNEFLYNYFSLKKNLDTIFIKEDDFINHLVYNIYNPKLLDSIEKFIESKYDQSIYSNFIESVSEKDTKSGFKIPEETIFNHEHIKNLYQISLMIKLFLPIALHYATIQKYKSTSDIKILINKIAEKMFVLNSQKTNIDLYTKIYILITKIVETSEKSDSLGWSRQEIFGETKDSVIEDLLIKLLINVIPRFDFEQNIINYINYIIQVSIKHVIRKKDVFEAKISTMIESDSTDGSDSGDFDIEAIENTTNKKDERLIIARNFLTDPTIDKIMQNNNIYITEDEFTFYFNSIDDKINSFQANMICQIFAKDFGGTENIINCDKYQFTKLLIILYKLVKEIGLDDLASLLVAKKDSYLMNRLNARYINKKLLSNPLYLELIDTKYRAVKSIFLEKFSDKKIAENPFIINLMILFNNNFVYNEFLGNKNGMIIDKKEKEDLIIEQFLTLCKVMIP